MERLKTRQRLEKLNVSTPPLIIKEYNEIPFYENSSHLASKIRVNSILNQSIPDYVPKKMKSHITAQELEEFQRQENTPIEIEGRIYRMHPASIPEPEFEEVISDTQIKNSLTGRSEVGSEINNLIVELKQTRKQLQEKNKQLEDLDTEYNAIMNKPISTYSSVSELMGLQYKKSNAEEEYILIKEKLIQEREEIIAKLNEIYSQLQGLRNETKEYDENLSGRLAEENTKKERNKAKLRQYEENLKTLNRNFNLVQEPNESNEEYIARLKAQTQAVEDPNLLIDRIHLYEARRFKENLKEIIRNTSTIEYAYNTLFQEDDSYILEINKIFALIKARYEKTFGNYQLKGEDLVKFLKQMIENPDENARKEEESLNELSAGGDNLSLKYKALATKGRYTKPDLISGIQELIEYKNEPLRVLVKGKPATLNKGVRGGISYNYDGRDKALTQADKDILIAFYVDLLQSVKEKDGSLYDRLNEKLNTRTQGEYGEGLGVLHEQLPKSCKLGKIEVDLNKLFYKNILSVKHNGFKINGVKNTSVSDEFVKIIMELCKGKYPTTKELNKLQLNENQTFDALLHLAGLHKRVEHTANKSVENLKKRLTLIEGELVAGNTNKELYNELRDIVFKLHHLGEITQNSATEYLKQMK